MEQTRKPTVPFLALRAAAAELGVPMGWLKAEADAGRVPCLRIKQRYLFDLDELREALLQLARSPEDRRSAGAADGR